jgi:deoxyribodipyrimidine photolyase
MGPVQIVWFKRDLRVVDHQPLLQAVARTIISGLTKLHTPQRNSVESAWYVGLDGRLRGRGNR